jgi:hypothetical protein
MLEEDDEEAAEEEAAAAEEEETKDGDASPKEEEEEEALSASDRFAIASEGSGEEGKDRILEEVTERDSTAEVLASDGEVVPT